MPNGRKAKMNHTTPPQSNACDPKCRKTSAPSRPPKKASKHPSGGWDSTLLWTSQNLETRLHAVERVPPEGRGKSAQFIPIRFVFTNKLGKDEKLLLAFDAFVLSEMLGREVSLGKIIHGDDHATLKVKTSALAGEVRKRTRENRRAAVQPFAA